MDTINNIELNDESIFPDDTVLKKILNESFGAYKKLLELFDKYDLTYQWRYYKDGKAWLCKVQKKNKTIVWMSAWKDYMQATIYFPEKHIENIYNLNISVEAKEKYRLCKNVGRSKPFIFELRSEAILNDFENVMLYKIKCK